jgi:phage terminase large subunit-like protein
MEARLEQLPPPGDWSTWLVMGGRGSGKTRLGAEWVQALAYGYLPASRVPVGRIALIGETYSDVREVMIDGPSGIRAISRGSVPIYEPTRKRLLFDNGAVAQVYSAQEPDGLRGPQFEAAWCDEFAKWPDPQAVWDMLQFGLRLGVRPRQLVTTTPRPIALLKAMLADPAVAVTRMTTASNAANLAARFLASVTERYAGTRLGRQELDGDLIEDRPGALWTRGMIEATRSELPEEFDRVVVAVDPPASAHARSDACGIVAVGASAGRAFVIADRTLQRARPHEWASAAVALYHRLGADRIVAEANQGGDMVASVIRAADANVALRLVHASRGKMLRAEPVAALYEQGRVRHGANLPELEDEMCDFGPGGLSNGRSPDRLDALVWAVTELMLSGGAEPKIRRLT